MNRFGIQAILRSVTSIVATDGDLLDRYRRERDDAAFRSLVERYGRLVWAVCRNLTRSDADAEDAFQATFLVLSQKSKAIQKSDSLAAWLHGVAYRISLKSRRANVRRSVRERSNGKKESTNDIPDSAWDRALAAVHDEVAKLPDSLRVPFIMCCLEGHGTTEAAKQLGWKLGTLSGRLTRAKDAIIAKLDARGLTTGAIATATLVTGAANAPATLIERTVSVTVLGTIVPQSIQTLTHGVFQMSTIRAKLLAAAVLLACGLSSGVGGFWVANAQDSPKKEQVDPAKKKSDNEALKQYSPFFQGSFENAITESDSKNVKKPSKWEYHLLQKPSGYAPSGQKFLSTVHALETDGDWEFVGMMNTKEGDEQPTLPTLIFRRPSQHASLFPAHRMPFDLNTCSACHVDSKNNPANSVSQLAQSLTKSFDRFNEMKTAESLQSNKEKKLTIDSTDKSPMDFRATLTNALDSLEQKNAKIKDLENQIAALRSNSTVVKSEFGYQQKDLPIGINELQEILNRVAPKIGVKNLSVSIKTTDGGSLFIKGDTESVEWARLLIQSLSGATVKDRTLSR